MSHGYLFIPIIVDTLFKLGIDKNSLLDKSIDVLEQIGHIAGLHRKPKKLQVKKQ
jgi:hypothetical protein